MGLSHPLKVKFLAYCFPKKMYEVNQGEFYSLNRNLLHEPESLTFASNFSLN